MTPDELRAIMDFLTQKVRIENQVAGSQPTIQFDIPTTDEMALAGIDPQNAQKILDAPWWDEMVNDIIETPEMCDADDPHEQILQYARDVVAEYIRKRFEL